MNATAPVRTHTVSNAIKPCDCGTFQIGDENGTVFTPVPCGGATTKRTFAPGHDARLKGFLITAAVTNVPVRRVMDGKAVDRTAMEWANAYGFAHLVRDGVDRHLAKALARSSKQAARVAKVEAPVESDTVHVHEVMDEVAAKLTSEDEATVREALGTFIVDVDEAHDAANLEVAERAGQAAGREIVAQLEAEQAELVTAKIGRHQYQGEVVDGQFHYTDRQGNAKVAKKFTLV